MARIYFTMRSIASLVFSKEPNAVSRKYPSPLGPNPEPGVPTTFALFNKKSKKSQDGILSGVCNQMYGAFTPPNTVYPAFFDDFGIVHVERNLLF